jgi:mannose/cellobiose epimerase-like protein (N-acyl-D-glucosamine 2-epimerase family)
MSRTLKDLSGDLQAWLNTSALPLWHARAVDRVNGGFIEWMSQDGQPRPAAKRCYPQARQIYVFAQAGLMGWDGPWRETVEQGLDFFLRAFPRSDGLMRLRVGADGAAEDETPRLYDQAFALLVLATARRVLPERAAELEARAVVLRDRLLADQRAPHGGFIEVVGQPFYANPNMHLLEAALAWVETSDDPAWGPMADEIAELALAKYIDPRGGFLREYFDAAWSPAAGDDGRLVEPGHQFEWAWLLINWSRLRGRSEELAPAARLYEVGRLGVDKARGIAINALWDDLSVRDADARTWPQTEWIKAAVAMAGLWPAGSARRAELEADVAAAIRALDKYLQTPVKGLWWDRYLADGSFADEPAPSTSFYHIVCAIAELRTLG